MEISFLKKHLNLKQTTKLKRSLRRIPILLKLHTMCVNLYSLPSCRVVPTRLPFSNSALMASFVRSYSQYRYLDSFFSITPLAFGR